MGSFGVQGLGEATRERGVSRGRGILGRHGDGVGEKGVEKKLTGWMAAIGVVKMLNKSKLQLESWEEQSKVAAVKRLKMGVKSGEFIGRGKRERGSGRVAEGDEMSWIKGRDCDTWR